MRLLILSDPHYVGKAEEARLDYETRHLESGLRRWIVRAYRRFLWMRDPRRHNRQLETLMAEAPEPDRVIVNGDLSLDSGFVGLADADARASAREFLSRIESRYGRDRLRITLGDHDLGKLSMMGGLGGMRVAAWEGAVTDLNLAPFWMEDLPGYRLVGVCSSVVALPKFEPETLAEEAATWRALREAHLCQVREAFAGLDASRRIILFCHDPSALPYLSDPAVLRREWMDRIALTVLGHLHSPFIWRMSRYLSGMPEIRRGGRTLHRISAALRRAGSWWAFRPVLCPSPSGVQCFKDGGYLTLTIPPDGSGLRFERHRLSW